MGIYKKLAKLSKKIDIEKTLIKRVGGWDKIIQYSIVIITLFLISGGLVTSFSGERTGGMMSQSVMEFMTFLLVNFIFLISAYLMYRGFSKSRIDTTLVVLGMIMLIITFIAEIYILSSFYTS